MNVINVIEPYRHLEMWVFDDPRVGLSQEPFVGGADTMIDRVTADLPNAEKGEDGSGNVYYSSELDAEGWLCPALLRYFDERPPEIHVQIKAKRVTT